MTSAPKIAAKKKQPISILCEEKYLTYTALTVLNPDIVHKTTVWNNIYKKLKHFTVKLTSRYLVNIVFLSNAAIQNAWNGIFNRIFPFMLTKIVVFAFPQSNFISWSV